MLPYLNPRKSAGVIMAKRTPKETTEPLNEEGEHQPGMIAAAESLISAVHAKDANAVASALKEAAEYCDSYEDEGSEPFEQGEA